MKKKLIKIFNKILNLDIFINFYTFIAKNIDFKKKTNKKIRLNSKKTNVFIAVKDVNWEKVGLVDSWENIADVYHFDWGSNFNTYSNDWELNKKKIFNDLLIEKVIKVNEEKKIDIFFSYLSGGWVYQETIEKIKSLGIYTINFCFDDSHAFFGRKNLNGWDGTALISRNFDLNLTAQSKTDVLKYQLMKSNVKFIFPGGNQNTFSSIKEVSWEKKDIDICFIGQNYGIRKEYIEFLRSHNINILVKGKGWAEGEVTFDEMLDIYSRSKMILGFGFLGKTKRVALKGRDFEVPLTGIPYITSYCDELAEAFVGDKEILFYKDKVDLLDKITFYLNNQNNLKKIGEFGKLKSLKKHTWEKRWLEVIDYIKLKDDEE